MNNFERKLFHKLKKKKMFKAARSLAKAAMTLKSYISEEQFDQYHTLLGTTEMTKRLKSPSVRQQRKLKTFDQSQIREPEKKLKIAVCLSGQPRSLIHCIDSLKRFFHGHEVTYFCHSWRGQTDPTLLQPLGNFFFTESDSPDTSEFERQAILKYGLKDFNNNVKVPYVSPNVFPMWNGVQQAFLSIRKHDLDPAEFDLVCRMRYDNFWVGQFDAEDFNFSNHNLMIDRNYNGYGGYGDQFAIGLPVVMEKYFNLYNWLTSEFLRGGYSDRCFPEVMLKDYLSYCDIEIAEEDFGLRLLRPEFIGIAATEIPLRSHIASQKRNTAIAEYVKTHHSDLL